jgi:hypothetical protein
MNTITSLGNKNQYWAISELQKAITRYKSTRTRYANWASNDNRRHLNRAENTLTAAARTAASAIVNR